MKKAAFLVMIITVISKVLGFGRELVLSYVYGATAISDAYLVSQTIPITIFSLISVGVGIGFIPMYSKIRQDEGSLSANNFTSNLTNSLIFLASIVVVLVLLFTQPIVRLFASGFSGETLALTVNFTRITIFGVYFTAILHVFSGYLRVHENYVIATLVSWPMNLIIIGALFLSTNTSIYLIAVGSVVATASQLLILIPAVRKAGYRYNPIFNPRDKHIKSMVLIALPIAVGQSVNQINILVNRTIASGLAVGGISALNYANRLNDFVQGLFVVSIITVMYPIISKMAAEKDIKGLKVTIAEAISIISLLVIPATIGAMIFSEEIVALLFGRGAFTSDAIAMTGNALFFYSIGMLAFGLREILSRSFYALQDTKTPMINASIAVLINIILNIILSRYLGIGGLALANSISAMAATFLLFITIRRKIGSFGLKEIGRSFFKIILASFIMGVIAWGSFAFLNGKMGANFALIGAILIGALAYIVLIYFMKIPEVERTLVTVKNRLKSGNLKSED